jgi:subtilisin family serine protease
MGGGEARAQPYQGHRYAQAQRQIRRERRRQRMRRMRAQRMAAWAEQMQARRRANPALFDRGRRGEQVLRARVLAINPTPEALAQARANGFRLGRTVPLGDTGLIIVVLRAPPGMTTQEALDLLQSLDPRGVYDFDHVYDPSLGQTGARVSSAARTPTANGAGVKIGMIDAGVALDHPALAGAHIQTRSFTEDGRVAPSAHGAAIASLLVGNDDDFQGAAPGAELYAADVFGDSAEGGSAVAIANALAWLSSQGVRVVNISLTGPPNRALDAVCRAMIARGLILVAAAGNDGPTHPVSFPAATLGVIAVTAVDTQNRVYLSANRGPQIAFSAYGVEVEAAVDDGAYEMVSGTSFAAPQVAAALALRIRSAVTPDQAVAMLAPGAVDLGAPGRDDIYGYGLVRR